MVHSLILFQTEQDLSHSCRHCQLDPRKKIMKTSLHFCLLITFKKFFTKQCVMEKSTNFPITKLLIEINKFELLNLCFRYTINFLTTNSASVWAACPFISLAFLRRQAKITSIFKLFFPFIRRKLSFPVSPPSSIVWGRSETW